ncbi:MAG TPA: 1-deoxy-D-xylulose-5-phosphate reductoisomerase [Spirochaetota bacterium]|nr:1-deoxy-D-xylulose-5-phosphate reductoisomerase [Spirochaetota bacterium]
MKNISVLGITGSIGHSTLKVLDNYKKDFNLISISTHSNVKNLLKLIDIYKPEFAVVSDRASMFDYFGEYEKNYNNIKIYSGEDGLYKICSDRRNNIIVNAISGKSGLIPSYNILTNGIDLALANKESIVCAGPILKEIAKKNGCNIIPIDSEHSAIFHLLRNRDKNEIEKIYLTASGGPFFRIEKKEWHKITVKEALNHPTWKMGNKISIDSATMANKGLEVIEAERLFDISYDKINVLIHPQSLIHSMIEIIDGEIYAQIGPNDMAIPIQNALFYPEIRYNSFNRFNFNRIVTLEIFPVDLKKFRMLDFAFYCGKKSGVYPAFYNFINEISVNLFLNEKIKFTHIEEIMEESLENFEKEDFLNKNILTMENIKITEDLANNICEKLYDKFKK